MHTETLSRIKFYKTGSHSCSYLEGKQATTLFVDPALRINDNLYNTLSNLGFRRSGAHLYRPNCDGCKACISCRVRVQEFTRNRRFQKIWKRNADLHISQVDTLLEEELFELYVRYINARHRDGDMYPPTTEQYQSLITSQRESTEFYIFRQGNKIVSACVIDVMYQGISAIYTFFRPQQSRRSLGNFSILWQIEKTVAMLLPYLYLGYWVRDCAKMSYKTQFQPI